MEGITTTAEAVSNYGFMVVASAVLLTLTVLVIKYMMSMFKEMFDKQQLFLEEMFQRAKPEPELNYEQCRIVNATLHDLFKYQLMDVVESIFIRIDETTQKEEISERVYSEISTLYDEANNSLRLFTYKGMLLSAFTNEEWIKRLATPVIMTIITSQEHKQLDENGLWNNMESAFNRIKLEYNHNLLTRTH